MKLNLVLIFLLVFFQNFLYGSGKLKDIEIKKTHQAVRTQYPPKIDGVLDDQTWDNLLPAKDFIQYEPFNGWSPDHPTEVFIAYDNRSFYVAAMLYDSSPDSILKELGKRDQRNLNADWFSVDVSPYNDGLNSFEFRVTVSGIQIDIKHTSTDSELNWDAVWKSAATITDEGWAVEMEIPYSAIRFPKTGVQDWAINFWRSVRRNRQASTWNYVDRTVDGIRNQYGSLEGIENIKPPLRLSFEPYLSGYMERSPEEPWKFAYSYGTDLKLGLNEAFTLDMTLIPDFGQTESDDIVIDLSPFEVYYRERRQFFTEGLELFSRGDIFYSRRIGATPVGYEAVEDLYPEENIIENPDQTRLINATKISGRNSKGLGIGVFNAMTANTEATVTDSSGQEIKVMTQPFTNYNMLVFDQSLKNNSYFSIYNTNVYMGDFSYTANVTGTQFRLVEKSNTYAFTGLLNISQKYHPDTAAALGHKIYARAEKISGNFLFGIEHTTDSDTYDPNDLGFNRKPNDMANQVFAAYEIYDPFWKILEMENELELSYYTLYAPREYVSFSAEYSNRTKFRNQTTVGLDIEWHPFERHDYFEARYPLRLTRYPADFDIGAFYSPDYTRNFVVDISAGTFQASAYQTQGYRLRIGPRIRFSDKFFTTYSFNYNLELNDIGYVTDSIGNTGNPVIIFGSRDVRNITNTLNINYTFSNKINLSARLRHYWFKVDYNQYYDLRDDGYLDAADYSGDYDFNFNAFNVDMFLTWYFAPGSEMVLAWKNGITAFQDPAVESYFENFSQTLSSPATNSISVKLIYFLDYQYFKRKNKNPS
jgi:hypothetical protein